MDKNRQPIIKAIAQELDCGFDCWYHPQTGELLTIPGLSYSLDKDDFREAFKETLERIASQKKELIKFEALKPFESFRIMEAFVRQLPDSKLQAELEIILAHKKSFKNFKIAINLSNYRACWFNFKQEELEKIVEIQLRSSLG